MANITGQLWICKTCRQGEVTEPGAPAKYMTEDKHGEGKCTPPADVETRDPRRERFIFERLAEYQPTTPPN